MKALAVLELLSVQQFPEQCLLLLGHLLDLTMISSFELLDTSLHLYPESQYMQRAKLPESRKFCRVLNQA